MPPKTQKPKSTKKSKSTSEPAPEPTPTPAPVVVEAAPVPVPVPVPVPSEVSAEPQITLEAQFNVHTQSFHSLRILHHAIYVRLDQSHRGSSLVPLHQSARRN